MPAKVWEFLPRSLKFSPPLKSLRVYRIAEKFGWQFLNLRITECRSIISNSEKTKLELTQKLTSILGSDEFELYEKLKKLHCLTRCVALRFENLLTSSRYFSELKDLSLDGLAI